MELARSEGQQVIAIYSHRSAVSVLADSARSIGIAGQTDKLRGGRGTLRAKRQSMIKQSCRRGSRETKDKLPGRLQLTILLTQSCRESTIACAFFTPLRILTAASAAAWTGGCADARRNGPNLPRTVDLRQRFLDHG